MRCDTSRPRTRAIADSARAGWRVGCCVSVDLGDQILGRLEIGLRELDPGVVSGGWRKGEIGGR